MSLADFVNNNFEWDEETKALPKEAVQMKILAQLTELNSESNMMTIEKDMDNSIAGLMLSQNQTNHTSTKILGLHKKHNSVAPSRSFSSHQLLTEKYM